MTLPLTLAEARTHIETDLGDPALQRLIDDADAFIVERHGAHANALTQLIYGGTVYLYPKRRASAVTSITEYASESDTTGTLLAATDYRIELGGWRLRRLTTGPNGSVRWSQRVSVVYTGADEAARRTRVEIDLVRLACTYEGLKKNETIGDYSSGGSVTADAYDRERESLVAALGKKLAFA